MSVTNPPRPTYGINAFGSGRGPKRFDAMTALAKRAEAAGCTAVWTSELYSRSATVPMAVLAQATERVAIGSNIAYGVGRSPLMWAAEARDLDELSGGRLILGLGNGTPAMMTNWHGVDGSSPAERMTELIAVLRKLWHLHEGAVDHDGDFYTVHVSPGVDMAPPLRPRLPIWIAGINKLMIRTAGVSADGLIGHPMFTRKYVDEVVRPQLEAGAAAAGRSTDDIAVMGIKVCSVDVDEEVARRRAAFAIGQYAASRVYDRLFAVHGWSETQADIRAAVRARDTAAVIAAVPDAVIDAIAVASTPRDFPDRLRAASVGFDHVDATAPPWGVTDEETLAATEFIVDGIRDLLSPRSTSEPINRETESVS